MVCLLSDFRPASSTVQPTVPIGVEKPSLVRKHDRLDAVWRLRFCRMSVM